MKKLFFLTLVVSLVSCGSNAEKQLRDIRQLQANKSLRTSDTLINSYIRFADQFPDHDSAVRFLFKAARASVRANKIMQGIRLDERIIEKYPKDTMYRPESMINAGMNYSHMPDVANAKKLWEMFLKEYPGHPRSADIRIMAEEAGMSEEEKTRRFWERFEKLRMQDSIARAGKIQ